MKHFLKIAPKYYSAMVAGDKTFEVRKNDRDYKVDDIVVFEEYSEPTGFRSLFGFFGSLGISARTGYTGRQLIGVIRYILDDGFVGLAKGYIVMQLEYEKAAP